MYLPRLLGCLISNSKALIFDLYEEKIELRFPKVKTSAKSVQTTAEV